MEKHEQEDFKQTLLGVGELHGKQITPAMTTIYWQAMKGFTLEQFNEGISKHCLDPDSGQFFPKPADIVKQLQGTSKDNARAVEDRAKIAWSVLMDRVARIGHHGNLELDDKQAIAVVKAMGGWRKLCMITYNDMPWREKEFISLYDTYENTPLEMLPNSLPGLDDLTKHKKEAQEQAGGVMAGLEAYRARIGKDG